jgi:dienelactone hydrolase
MLKLSKKVVIVASLGLLLVGFVAGFMAHDTGVMGVVKKKILSLFTDQEAQTQVYRQPELPYELVHDMRQMGFDPGVIQSPDQFDAWRESLLEKAEQLLAVDWCCQPYQAQYGEVENKLGFSQQRVVLESPDDGLDIVYYRLLPAGAENEGQGSIPGILVIPGSGIGVEGTLTNVDYQVAIAARLAKAGYVVYAIENLGWGERAIDAGTSFSPPPANSLGINSLMIGRPLSARYMRDARTVLHELSQDALVDPDNLGVVGCSLGGRIAEFVGLLEPDLISAIVVASGLGPEPVNAGPSQFVVPGMLQYFDSVDAAAAIAPRPLLLTYGVDDNLAYKYEYGTSETYNRLLPAWALMGAAENLVQVLHSLGHTYDLVATVDFFDQHLKD